MASTQPPRLGTAATATNRPGPGHAGAGYGASERATNGAAATRPATTAGGNHQRRLGSDQPIRPTAPEPPQPLAIYQECDTWSGNYKATTTIGRYEPAGNPALSPKSRF